MSGRVRDSLQSRDDTIQSDGGESEMTRSNQIERRRIEWYRVKCMMYFYISEWWCDRLVLWYGYWVDCPNWSGQVNQRPRLFSPRTVLCLHYTRRGEEKSTPTRHTINTTLDTYSQHQHRHHHQLTVDILQPWVVARHHNLRHRQ